MAEFFAASLGRPPGVRNALNWSTLLEQDQPRAPAPESWTIPEAFVAVLLAAVTADDELSVEEHEEILALVHRSRALKTLSTRQLAEINVKVNARMRDDAFALQQACTALPQEMRPSVFAHALDLVLADGELSGSEADFLNTLILHLGLAGEDVERIADVITLKNSY